MDKHTHHHEDRSSCHELLGGLSLYLDGDAEESLCREIEQHMKDCENCRVVVNTLAKTVELYHEYGKSQMPQEAKQRLFVALDLGDYISSSE